MRDIETRYPPSKLDHPNLDKNPKQIYWLTVLVSMVITSCGHIGSHLKENNRPPLVALQVGDQVTDFKAKDIDGHSFRMSDFLPIGPKTPKHPKAVLVSFFAIWCAPCRKELTELIRYQQKNPNDVQVLLIVLPPIDMQTRIQLWRYVDFKKTGVMTLFDQADNIWTRFLGEDNSGIPTCIYINKDGRVAARLVGYSPGTIEERIQDSHSLLNVP